MKESRKILIAVDDSDASTRAVRYVANIVGGRKNFTVRLFHVLDPLPPELRVFGASPVLERERELEAKSEEKRERWLNGAKEEARPVLERALSILRKARVPSRAVETQFWISVNKEDLVDDLIDAARLNKYGTIVVGRESFSWLRELFHTHAADQLVRKGQGFTTWVVE